jgi:S1-C subfamily serine protease
VPYVEKDVAQDQQAAHEMVRRSGQMGVPVITVDDNVIVGFDQPRLERLLASPAQSAVRLGAAVAPAKGGGLQVGRVHPGSLAERAGLREGDTIINLNGEPVNALEELRDRFAPAYQSGAPVRFGVRRNGQTIELRLASEEGQQASA